MKASTTVVWATLGIWMVTHIALRCAAHILEEIDNRISAIVWGNE